MSNTRWNHWCVAETKQKATNEVTSGSINRRVFTTKPPQNIRRPSKCESDTEEEKVIENRASESIAVRSFAEVLSKVESLMALCHILD